MIDVVCFYIAAAIALGATIMAMTRVSATHALIYLVVSLLGVAVIFYLIGAPFAAALEIVIYAGAIMVLFVFVIMMLNVGERGHQRERQLLRPAVWFGPALLALLLFVEMVYVVSSAQGPVSTAVVSPKQVGLSLYGPYVLAVEIASMLLMAGLVGAYHLGRRYLERRPSARSAPPTDKQEKEA